MQRNYRDAAIEAYGNKCELCGYVIVEVHHINYQLHQSWENSIRKTLSREQDIRFLLIEAEKLGFIGWINNQLGKDDRVSNLAVLCPNCHSMVHKADMGLLLLRLLPKRKI